MKYDYPTLFKDSLCNNPSNVALSDLYERYNRQVSNGCFVTWSNLSKSPSASSTSDA